MIGPFFSSQFAPIGFVLGLKCRIKDHYRSQKMALWLNLIPDLQSAAEAMEKFKASSSSSGSSNSGSGSGLTREEQEEEARKEMEQYKLYSELLPFVPNIKNIHR